MSSGGGRIRVLMDVSEVAEKLNGAAQYVVNLLRLLDESYHDEIEFLFILNKAGNSAQFEEHFPKGLRCAHSYVAQKVRPVGPTRDLEFLRIAGFLRGKYDVFLCPSEKWPYFMKGGIYVLHDARALDRTFPGLNALKIVYLQRLLKSGFKNSDVSVFVSETTRKSFAAKFNGLLDAKARVIYSPVIQSAECGQSQMRQEIRGLLTQKYFLFYGQLWRPHKNVRALIHGFEIFSKRNKSMGYKLVLGGEERGTLDDLDENENVVHLGYLTECERIGLLRNAHALAYVSLFEGFGIPIVEALLEDVRVVCSDIEVFRELYQGMAVFADPSSVDDIAECLEQSLSFHREKSDLTKFQPSRIAHDMFRAIRETAGVG
jgi:glycosyltransferase involved in cell wall biosynthesis